MATATALFGVPATILEGPGIDPWEAAPLPETPEHETSTLEDVTPGGPGDETPIPEDVTGAGDETPSGVDLAAFHALSAAALRDLAKALGVSTKGNKAAMVERITTSPLPLGMAELPAPFAHLTAWFTAAE
jgi:hypothetical protein